MNTYKYKTSIGSEQGYFNIYQGRNGLIYLMMGENITALTLEQIDSLNISVYSLVDFDRGDFHKAYGI